MSRFLTLPRLLAAGFLLLVFAGEALATGSLAERTLTAADKARLAAFDTTRREAIQAARAGGNPQEVAALDGILSGTPQSILGVDIRGAYRCRTIKLGGSLPLTIYDWFACRIDEDDIGYRLTKTSGSQRLSGHFIDEERTRLLYYGASHYADEAARRYGADAERDQVGYFMKVGPARYRLELPEPQFESKFDIIELEGR